MGDLEVQGKHKFIWLKLVLCGIAASSTKANWHSDSSDGTYSRSIQPCIKHIIFIFLYHCVREMLIQQFEAVFYDAVEFYCIVLKGGSNAKGQDSQKSHSTRVMSKGDFFLMHL